MKSWERHHESDFSASCSTIMDVLQLFFFGCNKNLFFFFFGHMKKVDQRVTLRETKKKETKHNKNKDKWYQNFVNSKNNPKQSKKRSRKGKIRINRPGHINTTYAVTLRGGSLQN